MPLTTPYPFQREGATNIETRNGRALVSDEMGLGKSFSALLFARRRADLRPIVCVCPAGLKIHWEREAAHHTGMRAVILEGTKPQLISRATPELVVVNYDILGPWLPYLAEVKPKLIIADEGHYLGNSTTQRTRWFKKLAKGVESLLILTGTPLTSRPAQLWSLLNLLWPKEFPKFRVFADEFCSPKLTHWGWKYDGATNIPKLHRLLVKLGMLRRLKKDVLDQLPDKRRMIVPLPLQNRKEYDTAHKNFLFWLRSRNPASDDGKRAEFLKQTTLLKSLVGELKLPSMKEWIGNFLEDSDKKLIFFGVHKKVLKPLHEHFRKLAVLVDGSVTGRDRQAYVDRFNTDPRCRLFIGNIKAAGVGWSCKSASTVAFGELSWLPAEHTQAEDRIHGIARGTAGQTADIYYLIAHNTIEAKLCKVLHSKQTIISNILEGVDTGEFDILNQLGNELLHE